MDTTAIRLLFRRGLEFTRASSTWGLPTDEQVLDMGSLHHLVGPEPIAVEQRFPDGQTRTSLLLPGTRSFGLEQTWLQQRFLANEHGGCRLDWLEVDYLLGAVGYHCLQMAEAYASVRKHFVRIAGSREVGAASFQGASDHIWYELDALLSAARRTLDMSRFLLWHAYGQGSCPRNFIGTLEAAKLPSPLRERLRSMWERFGVRLTDYRDCIQHNTHLTRDHGGVLMESRAEGVCLVTAPLPDNPEVKSLKRFSYQQGVDALDYAYSIAVEWIDAMKAVGRSIKPHPAFDND